MVLLSEVAVATAALVVISAKMIQYSQEFRMGLGMALGVGRNHASLLTLCILWSYAATRLQLETESPQSVVPIYVAIVLIFGETIKRGKYGPAELMLRLTTIYVVYGTIVFFVFFRGLTPLSEVAQKVRLDRTVTWYQSVVVPMSSLRWFFTFVTLMISVVKGKFGWLVMLFKIAIVWVISLGTGNNVFSSPWSAYDEILLERNALNLVNLGLISFAIFMDQLIATIVSVMEASGIEPDEENYAWEDFKEAMMKLGSSQNGSSANEA